MLSFLRAQKTYPIMSLPSRILYIPKRHPEFVSAFEAKDLVALSATSLKMGTVVIPPSLRDVAMAHETQLQALSSAPVDSLALVR